MRLEIMQLWVIGEETVMTDPVPGQPPAAQPASPPGWVAQLPNDLKSDESLTKFATLGDFAKEYKTAQGKLVELDGRVGKMIPKLPESPTADDLKAYRGAMGIPETPDKYEVKRVAQWPEALGPYPEQVETQFKEFAHKTNMTPAQVQAAYDWYMGNIVGSVDGAQANIDKMVAARREAAVNDLKKLWGDNYVANAEKATRAFWFYATPEDVKYFEDTGLADNAKLIKLFHKVYLHTSEDKMVRDAKPPIPDDQKPKTDAYGRVRLSYPSMEKG